MERDYSFLADELAVNEIKKHKWIESQKLGYEIGFASAAVDWIKKHGDAWKSFRLTQHNSEQKFMERRTFRRFPAQFPLRLTLRGVTIESQTQDFNLIGFSCDIPCFLPENTATKIEIDFDKNAAGQRPMNFAFTSTIKRVSKALFTSYESFHHIFIPFTDKERNFLRTQFAAKLQTNN